MKVSIEISGKTFHTDLSQGRSISTLLDPNNPNPKCFWAPDFKIEPVVADGFIGDLKQGGTVNFKNVTINPHGNGTHTECVGHIVDGDYYVSDALESYFWMANVVSIHPATIDNGDKVITRSCLENVIAKSKNDICQAIVIRTLPNDASKLSIDYTETNPPYISADAIRLLNEMGVRHLLLDLPSVDREHDDALFLAHKAFWGVDIKKIDTKKTITELVYIDNDINDGVYLCAIVPLRIQMDASPSNIILYPILEQ